MNRLLRIVLLMLVIVPMMLANTITIRSVNGTVEVRKGVSEEWKSVVVGDILKPEDTIRSGERSSAVLTIGATRVSIPEMTMVDMIDFRQMSREDFLLRLAMEDILSVPNRDEDKIVIPAATVLHGSRNGATTAEPRNSLRIPTMLVHGANVLFNHGYYATSVLRLKSTIALYPELKSNNDALIMLATGFEKMNLEAEAKGIYLRMLTNDLSDTVRKKIETSLERIQAKK